MSLSPPNPIRVMVVDDHPMLRVGVADVINDTPDMTVVGQASSATEAFEQAAAAKPDVVLLDLHLSEDSGLQAVAALRRLAPGVHILAYTGFLTAADVREAAASGVDGYLTKTCPAGELLSVLRKLAAGGSHWGEDTLHLLLQDGDSPTPSRRELEVLRLMAKGRTNKEIAVELEISVPSVVQYIVNARRKLGARNRAEAVFKGFKRGLI